MCFSFNSSSFSLLLFCFRWIRVAENVDEDCATYNVETSVMYYVGTSERGDVSANSAKTWTSKTMWTFDFFFAFASTSIATASSELDSTPEQDKCIQNKLKHYCIHVGKFRNVAARWNFRSLYAVRFERSSYICIEWNTEPIGSDLEIILIRSPQNPFSKRERGRETSPKCYNYRAEMCSHIIIL